ncbi:hypothetical protein [Lysobacter sp. Root604]|uniref:hypothetical protein n=1 Tax=Lysobacter sp. Root604 TaxID=1736568 RepID=UPI000700DAE1|nr:hypothetical protein [Lysobacter sp. Root604]KRA15357.1 hypothetical protein ASD69_17955 [Lysobacter sp. Root604]
MPSGFASIVGGVEKDFEDLFDPDIAGDGPAALWLENGGVALKFAAIAYGTKGPDVGYDDGGVDVSNLWAAKGTATYVIAGLQGKAMFSSDGPFTNQPSVTATVTLTLLTNGTWTASGGNSFGNVAQPAPTSGTWLTQGGSAGDYDVRFDVVDSGNASRQVINGAPDWTSLANTIAVSLLLPSAPANNANEREANANLRVRVRRRSSGQVVSDTTLTMGVWTTGWQ